MNKKEKIEQLERELAQLKAQPEPIEVGKWYYINGMIVFVEKFKHWGSYGIVGYGFNLAQEWQNSGTEWGIYEYDENRPATPAEIESALRKEWDCRCVEAGWDNGDEAEVQVDMNNGSKWKELYRNKFHPAYNECDDILWTKNAYVYEQGSWATPKPRKKAITINGYEAEFCDGYVKFGCAKIDSDLIDDMYGMIIHDYKGNRSIKSVKIGDGIFTTEDIKAIAGRL
jgi:hypothetical protein